MANKILFQAAKNRAPGVDTVNQGGGVAYKLSPKHALAQIAMTGTFNGTFYASPEDILDIAKQAAVDCYDDPEYIAKVAILAREEGYMKDMPAFLVAMLGELDTNLFRRVFNRVIDNGKMLRHVLQMARSGQLGKARNLSSGAYRRAIQGWFSARSPLSIWKASIGNEPSMRDILRMAHPRPDNAVKAALFAYLMGAEVVDGLSSGVKLSISGPKSSVRQHDYSLLPDLIRQYEDYKKTKQGQVPSVDWRFLDSLELGEKEWIQVARNAPWQMTRMNLATFDRHGVFKDKETVKIVADRLSSEEEIKKARVFPYQIMTTWKAAGEKMPYEIREALQDAMEIATANVPCFGGKVYICMDVSGSMRWAITSDKKGQRNSYGGWYPQPNIPQVIDAAALFASAIMRANPNCELLAFSNVLHRCQLNPRDTVLTNAAVLSRLPAGGTNCSLPLAYLNEAGKTGDAVIFVSDYESWIDTPVDKIHGRYSDGTAMHQQWIEFKKRNKHAKLVCMDLTPRDNGQVKDRPDILQVGGFSDRCFDVVKGFLESDNDPNYWVQRIQQIEIDKCVETPAV